MCKRSIFYIAIAGGAIVGAGLGTARAAESAAAAPVAAAERPAAERVPGVVARGALPAPALIDAIAAWLAQEFGLPGQAVHPAVRFEPAHRIKAFHHLGVLSDDPQLRAALADQRDVVAGYDPSTRTILLPAGWSPATPAQLSVLVHEMVHHLQHAARLRYACVQASEELAYAAQDRWLQRFGRSLASDFEIDGFTLLAATQCPY